MNRTLSCFNTFLVTDSSTFDTEENWSVCICSFLLLFFVLLRRSKVQTRSKQTAMLSLACRGRLSDLKQHRARFHVPDLEPGEVNAVNVFIWAAQIIWREDCDTDKTCEVGKRHECGNTSHIKARADDKYGKVLRCGRYFKWEHLTSQQLKV